MDLVDGSRTSAIVTSGLPINTRQTGNFTVTYSVCDLRTPPRCASISRMVMVVQTVVPVITLYGSFSVSDGLMNNI